MDVREDWSEYWAGKEKELTQTERLGLAYCQLNCWEWDDFIGEKPKILINARIRAKTRL